MAGNKSVVNMKKYKKKSSWNIGVFVFGVVFLYLLATIVMYVTKDRTAVYEVRQGSILKDNAYTALILRDETLVYSEEAGYVNYFVESGQKVAVRNKIYALSSDALETESTVDDKEDGVNLSSEEMKQVVQKVQNFNKTFKNENFHLAVELMQETSSIIDSKSQKNHVVKLNTMIKESDDIKAYKAKDDGIIELTMDGLEEVTFENFTSEMVNKTNYTKTELMNNTQISSGAPVYRLITGEDWTIVFQINKEMKNELKKLMGDRNYLNLDVRFLKDNEVMRGALLIHEKSEDEIYGYIEFSTSMIRYAQDRYLDIELILEDETGLKIPKSSLVEKEFYVIPLDYITTGGSSTENGVLKQTTDKSGNTITTFVPVDIYYKNEETGTVYIDPADFAVNDQILMPDSTHLLSLTDTEVLQGVYNVNKGYTIFKRIEILCESEEYYIIEEGSSYGLSNYDRIVLDGSSVTENQVVNQ